MTQIILIGSAFDLLGDKLIIFFISLMTYPTGLQVHIHHIEEVTTQVLVVGKRTVCPVCEKRYSCAANLRRHVRNVHKPNTGHIQFKYCSVCGKGEIKQYRLNAHMREVHQNNFVECDLCNKKYKQRRNLMRHMQTHHKE